MKRQVLMSEKWMKFIQRFSSRFESPIARAGGVLRLTFSLFVFAHFFALILPVALGDINIPSDGSDGSLDITNDTVIDLSLAVTGKWSDSNAGNSGRGIYDPNQWAVVFKYTSVNIARGARVSFKNHASRAPVVWLVKGDSMIAGVVSLDGRSWLYDPIERLTPNEPGPGGFRGGAIGPQGFGGGYGPGGANLGNTSSFGAGYGSGYGTPNILPLLGGSGAASSDGARGPGVIGGASGGGALLIASSRTLTIDGELSARGSGGYWLFNLYWDISGGGAIRLIADQINGTGAIDAGSGRTRVEANGMSPNVVINPNSVAVPVGETPQIWPPASAPTATVLSVDTQASPSVPLGGVQIASDISISRNDPVDVLIETKNFPPSGAVNLRIVPKYANSFDVSASFVSGTFSQSIWKASTPLPQGFCVLQAHATSP